MPVFGCVSSQFGDEGVDRLFAAVVTQLQQVGRGQWQAAAPTNKAANATCVLPPNRIRYLSEISDMIRAYHAETEDMAKAANDWSHIERAKALIQESTNDSYNALDEALRNAKSMIPKDTSEALSQWDSLIE